jgi:hypothetical protein
VSQITAPSAGGPAQLEDYEPYRAWLRRIDFEVGSAEYGSQRRIVVDWALSENPDDTTTIRDWISLRLGRQQSGQVSKLRALLNALAGKPETEEVAYFNDDGGDNNGNHPLCWGYVLTGPPYNRLTEGTEVVFRGKHGKKSDGQPKFTITTYQAPKKSQPAAGSPGTEPGTGFLHRDWVASPEETELRKLEGPIFPPGVPSAAAVATATAVVDPDEIPF